MNITSEQTKETRIPRGNEKKWIKDYLKEHFGYSVSYNGTENTIYLTDNNDLTNVKMVELLKKYKVFLQLSLT